jgi:uncharacterized protein with FMN-binding domain
MSAATAIPVLTTVELLAHTADAGNPSSTTVAQAPSATVTPSATETPTQTPAATATPTTTRTPSTHTYVGPAVQDQFGAVQATITVTGNKITKVQIAAPMDDQRSAFINSQAVPLLQSETLQAQSANVNVISGATETSDAYVQSLQGALQSARIA